MPEEINRVLTDQISTCCFTHSPGGTREPRSRGGSPTTACTRRKHDDRHAGGMRPQIVERTGGSSAWRLEPGSYLVVTLHRPALVDGPLLATRCAALDDVAGWTCRSSSRSIRGPRPRCGVRAAFASPGMRLLEPLGYVEFLSLMQDSAGVLTDSGGMQEETTYLGIPCFTLRDNTERPITCELGTNRPARPCAGAHQGSTGPDRAVTMRGTTSVPAGWDGEAAERLVDVLLETDFGSDPGARRP